MSDKVLKLIEDVKALTVMELSELCLLYTSPFGHGRMEYLSALAVAALIMVAGFELGK